MVSSPASVQYGATFALVGGSRTGSTGYKDTIQIFNPDDLTFSLVEDTLTVPRRGSAVILVNEDLFPEC